MKSFKLIILLISIFLSETVTSQVKMESILGKEIPNLHLPQVLNHHKNYDELDNHKGKVVILDFWATWCSPCLKGFSHLQELREEFKGDVEVFMVTTSDSAQRIKKFLEKFKTGLPIVIDTTYTIQKEFPYRTIPHTIVLDGNRIVKAVSTPEELTADIITKIINGESHGLEEKRDYKHSSDTKKEGNADNSLPSMGGDIAFDFSVTKGYEPTLSNRLDAITRDTVLVVRRGIAGIHKKIHGERTWSRVLFERNGQVETINEIERSDTIVFPEKDDMYNVRLVAPGMSIEEKQQFLFNYFETVSPLRSRKEKRKVKAWVLRRTTDELLLPPSDPSKKGGAMSGAGVHLSNADLSWLVFFMEGFGNFGGRPVVDETGLKGEYELKLSYLTEDPDAFFKELNTLGLEAVLEEREVEMLIIYDRRDPLRSEKKKRKG